MLTEINKNIEGCGCWKCTHQKPQPSMIHLYDKNGCGSIDRNKYYKFNHKGHHVSVTPKWLVWYKHNGKMDETADENHYIIRTKKSWQDHGIMEIRNVKIYKRKFLFFHKLVVDMDVKRDESLEIEYDAKEYIDYFLSGRRFDYLD